MPIRARPDASSRHTHTPPSLATLSLLTQHGLPHLPQGASPTACWTEDHASFTAPFLGKSPSLFCHILVENTGNAQRFI